MSRVIPGAQPRGLDEKLGEHVSVLDFVPSSGGLTVPIGDGATHPLSDVYATLAAAQIVFPFATTLTNELGWCAIQAALNYASTFRQSVFLPAGVYWCDQTLTVFAQFVNFIGEGPTGQGIPQIKFTGGATMDAFYVAPSQATPYVDLVRGMVMKNLLIIGDCKRAFYFIGLSECVLEGLLQGGGLPGNADTAFRFENCATVECRLFRVATSAVGFHFADSGSAFPFLTNSNFNVVGFDIAGCSVASVRANKLLGSKFDACYSESGNTVILTENTGADGSGYYIADVSGLNIVSLYVLAVYYNPSGHLGDRDLLVVTAGNNGSSSSDPHARLGFWAVKFDNLNFVGTPPMKYPIKADMQFASSPFSRFECFILNSSFDGSLAYTVSAATNANPAVLAIVETAGAAFPDVLATDDYCFINGATSDWFPANGSWQVTLDPDTAHVSIPLDSTAFGVMTGSLVLIPFLCQTNDVRILFHFDNVEMTDASLNYQIPSTAPYPSAASFVRRRLNVGEDLNDYDPSLTMSVNDLRGATAVQILAGPDQVTGRSFKPPFEITYPGAPLAQGIIADFEGNLFLQNRYLQVIDTALAARALLGYSTQGGTDLYFQFFGQGGPTQQADLKPFISLSYDPSVSGGATAFLVDSVGNCWAHDSFRFLNTSQGVFGVTGNPAFAATEGSLAIVTNGTVWVNTSGSTTWTQLLTATGLPASPAAHDFPIWNGAAYVNSSAYGQAKLKNTGGATTLRIEQGSSQGVNHLIDFFDTTGAVLLSFVDQSGNFWTSNEFYFYVAGGAGTTVGMILSNGNPNGALTATKGSLAFDYSGPDLYQNTNGGTAWKKFASGTVLPTGSATGDFPVWNGSSWVLSSALGQALLENTGGATNFTTKAGSSQGATHLHDFLDNSSALLSFVDQNGNYWTNSFFYFYDAGLLLSIGLSSGAPVYAAVKGSLAIDFSTPAFYQNNNGSTGWTQLGASAYNGATNQTNSNPWYCTPTGSRAIGAIYQNLTGIPVDVSASISASGTSFSIFAYCDSGSTPSRLAGISTESYAISSAVVRTLYFTVPPNHYYQVNVGGALSSSVYNVTETK